MSLKYINQSLVKASEREKFCSRQYMETFVLGNFVKEPTLSMIQGQYFEYLATGALNREGEVPELPLTQKGKPTTAQLRIEWQAKQFAKNLESHDIELVSIGAKLGFKLFNEFLTTGIEDTEVLYKGRPYIMDIKLTGDIENDFGDYCWGDFQRMDKLQAYTYVLLKYHMTGIVYGFIYYVADHKKNPSYKILEVDNPIGNHQEVYRRFKQTFLRMKALEMQDYPPAPSENCEKCPVTTCSYQGKAHKFKKQIISEKSVIEEMSKIAQARKFAESRSKFAQFQKQKSKLLLHDDYDIIY